MCLGPFIDDVAPPAQKTLWFGILYLFPTVGIAGGYIFGGVIGISMGWRAPFLIQVTHAYWLALELQQYLPTAVWSGTAHLGSSAK